MATHITDECINCGACEPECPNDAISEGDSITSSIPSCAVNASGSSTTRLARQFVRWNAASRSEQLGDRAVLLARASSSTGQDLG